MWKRIVSVLVIGVLALVGCSDDEPDIQGAPAEADIGAFDTLDANGDSYLDVDEIAESEDDLGVFDAWDVDSDSELDRDEIAGNAFELWDADGNGSVSEVEWKDGTERWYPADVEVTVFGDWDGDGDSELDADEFNENFDVSSLGESWRSDTVSESTFKLGYFELYDEDDDGKVSESEWESGSAVWGTPEE